jgi:peptide/nickel transport system substrate-binding protein
VQHRSSTRRASRALVSALLVGSMALAACSKSDGGDDAAKPDDTAAPSDSSADTTPVTEPAATPVPGGELVVSGGAEVANPWTPAAMQCDSYCFERAFTFFDPVATVGTDLKVHGVLAESITPNDDFTVWTIKVRPGITFSDGTAVDAAAIVRNLNETGSSLLVSKALVDVARNADGTFVTELLDDMTFTIAMGKNGDPAAPMSWPGFDFYLTGQWGLIASPAWLDAVKADPSKATSPVGSGPFLVQSYAPHDQMIVTRNPNYWRKDANGVQYPYLDKITFKVIEDSATAAQALQDGNIDIFATGYAQVISDFREMPDEFPMVEQSQFVSTGYLLIDLSKTDLPTADERVRCAISKAIDRQEISDLVYAGIPTPANGLFSPGQEGYLEDNGFDPAQDIEGAKALIADYQAEHPGPISITLGHTADRSNDQLSELVKGYLAEIGITLETDTVPQDQFITLALLGDDRYQMFAWAQHGGVKVDGQNFWWNSASGTTRGVLSLNFARINDPVVDESLATARSAADPAARQAAAETINRTFAEHCYQIPVAWGPTGVIRLPKVQGLGAYTAPDGTPIQSGEAVYPLTSIWIAE